MKVSSREVKLACMIPDLPTRNTHQVWKFLITARFLCCSIPTPTASVLICKIVGTAVHEVGVAERRSCKEEMNLESYLVPRTWATSVTDILISLSSEFFTEDYLPW